MSREQTITTAAAEYARRPADERFDSPQALLAAGQYDKAHSREVSYNTRDLTIAVAKITGTDRSPVAESLQLQSPKGSAGFTHWSFGQLCRMLGAPAGYLRQLPPAIAADALNYGLHDRADHATDARLLVKANGGQPIVRACTSETYGRVWDADLHGAILDTIGRDQRWQTPPTWTGEPAGAYRGDRDSFLILVNGGSIVSDPSLRNTTAAMRPALDSPSTNTTGGSPHDGLYRGIMVRNSEVGACSITIDEILFRYICGNHMLWGATYGARFRRRHVGDHAKRDAIRTILELGRRLSTESAATTEGIIRQLISHEIAHTREAVIDELQKIGATKIDAAAAYDRAEQTETASPRSYWGIAQGLTRVSQDAGYEDERLQLDQLAAAVLTRGRKLVAV